MEVLKENVNNENVNKENVNNENVNKENEVNEIKENEVNESKKNEVNKIKENEVDENEENEHDSMNDVNNEPEMNVNMLTMFSDVIVNMMDDNEMKLDARNADEKLAHLKKEDMLRTQLFQQQQAITHSLSLLHH